MRFKSMTFKHYAAIEQASIDFSKQATILVGRNGSGKTTALSVLFDAMVSLKQVKYNEISETKKNKLLRPIMKSSVKHHVGTAIAVVDMDISGESRKFIEVIDSQDGVSFPSGLPHPTQLIKDKFNRTGLFKGFIPSGMPAKYLTGPHVIAFYPAGRAERPGWLGGSILADFSLDKNFIDADPYSTWRSSVIDSISAWILNVILDAELYDVVTQDVTLEGGHKTRVRVNVNGRNRKILIHLNRILSLILHHGDESYVSARLVVTQRQRGVRSVSVHATKVGGEEVAVALDLNAMSSGELALFTIFADIVQLAERTGWAGASISDITGIVLIDELDVHLHLSLQVDLIQELFKIFSGIQFIATGHSPFMLMGLSEDQCSIVSMPSGTAIPPSQYSEFQLAYDRFNEHGRKREEALSAVIETLEENARPLIATEGKTDIDHLNLAISVLSAAGKIDPLDVRFIDKSKVSGDDDLMRLYESACKIDLIFPLVCVFDRDNQKHIKKIEGEAGFISGGTCAAMCIETPSHRDLRQHISIEHLYNDQDFFRMIDGTKKRLRVFGEIRRSADVKTAYVVEDGDFDDMRIFDQDVSRIGDARGNEVGELAISKPVFFSDIILKNKDDVDFSGFIPTIEKIRTILDSLSRSQRIRICA